MCLVIGWDKQRNHQINMMRETFFLWKFPRVRMDHLMHEPLSFMVKESTSLHLGIFCQLPHSHCIVCCCSLEALCAP